MHDMKPSSDRDTAVVYIFARVRPELKPYVPVMGVGITLLLNSWDFPVFQREGAVNTRIALSEADRASLAYLVEHSGKTSAEVISAALALARSSKVKPPEIRRGRPRRAGGAAAPQASQRSLQR